uniref:CCHC-type domain-containing protein n=1 Tax=Cannabis sativa TaxID=3483 RepID=A0A803PRV4_CANSA
MENSNESWKNDLTSFPIWGRAWGVPIDLLTTNNAVRMEAKAGEVITVQNSDISKMVADGFFRFRIWMSINKPVCPGFPLPCSGQKKWIAFQYEELPFMCFKCGRIGHCIKDCHQDPIMVQEEGTECTAAYGKWLKAGDIGREESQGKSDDGSRGKHRIVEDYGDLGYGKLKKSATVLSKEIQDQTLYNIPVSYAQEAHILDGSTPFVLRKKWGLILLWAMDVETHVQSFSPFHIDSFVRIENGQWWRFTGFYGDPDPSQRFHSWKLLKRISRMYSGPWVVGGDFNEIVSQREKKGGLPKPNYLIHNFRKALDSCHLQEVGYEGSDYTWCNGRKNDLIFERLDRVCGNSDWFDMFALMKVCHLDRTNSDHCPLLLMDYDPNLKITNATRWRTRFHFESAWAEDEECSNIVNSVWQQDKQISNTRELKIRLSNCGVALQQWNKTKKQEMTRHLKEYEDKITFV